MSRSIATILSLKDNMSGGLLKVNKNVTNMSSEMKKASQQSAMFANNAKKNFEKVGDKALKLGLVMAGLATGFVIKVGLEGMKELDEASAKVKSIAGASLDKKDIKKGLLKASNETGITTSELGNTQYDAISSGVSAKDSLGASISAAKLAKAGFTDSTSALKILTSTMNVYGLKGEKAMTSISDKLLITQNLGVTTVAELAESMGSLTPIAKSSGLSIDELMASMVGLTKNGIKTDEAVTSMKGIMTSIISPSKESADMAKELGINFSVAGLKSKGFIGFMEEIKKKTGGSTEKMAGLFGNVRALSGALVLAGDGLKDAKAGMDGMSKSSGATQEAFDVMENTIGAKWDKLKNRIKNTATAIMDSQSGLMGDMVSKVTDKLKELEENGSIQRFVDKVALGVSKTIEVIGKVFNFLKENKKTIENIALTFAGFYVAIKVMKVLKGIILGVQIAMSLFSGALALTPFGWIVIGITALIVGFVLLYKNSAKFRAGVAIMIGKLKEFGSYIMINVVPVLKDMAITIKDSVMSAFKFLYPIVLDFMTNVLIPLANFIGNVLKEVFSVVFPFILDTVKTTFNIIKGVIEGAIRIFGGILQFITGVFTGDWDKAWLGVSNIFGGIWDGLKAIAFGALNGIIDKVNFATGLINKIPGINIPKMEHIGEDKGTKGNVSPSAQIPNAKSNFGLNIPKKATGTAYAQAGLTLMHEKGGEIRKASSGEMIIPADKSKKLIEKSNGGHVFNFTFNGNVGTDEFFTDVSEKVSDKLLLILGNI